MMKARDDYNNINQHKYIVYIFHFHLLFWSFPLEYSRTLDSLLLVLT